MDLRINAQAVNPDYVVCNGNQLKHINFNGTPSWYGGIRLQAGFLFLSDAASNYRYWGYTNRPNEPTWTHGSLISRYDDTLYTLPPGFVNVYQINSYTQQRQSDSAYIEIGYIVDLVWSPTAVVGGWSTIGLVGRMQDGVVRMIVLGRPTLNGSVVPNITAPVAYRVSDTPLGGKFTEYYWQLQANTGYASEVANKEQYMFLNTTEVVAIFDPPITAHSVQLWP